MTLQELTDYIFDTYSVEPDHPFARDNESSVFRHIDNKKWFAIAMNVPYRILGIHKAGNVDIVNVKCDPFMVGPLRGKPGFLPAYHMNKDKWITMLLDGSADKEDIIPLVSFSFEMTRSKEPRKRRKPEDDS